MKATEEITNTQDVIDSRDVIARIEALESELLDAHTAEGNDGSEFDEWLTNAEGDDKHTLQEAAHELLALRRLESGELNRAVKPGGDRIREEGDTI